MESSKEETYTFSVDLAAVEHLGLNLYSNTAAALTEIIANAWDADATEVKIDISDDNSTITISDDGHGMNVNDLNEKFLKVAYKRRLIAPRSPNGRPVMGRKGIGKLALFSIAKHVRITTKKINDSSNTLEIDINDLHKSIADNTPYHPQPTESNNFNKPHGTEFVLTNILSERVGLSVAAMKKRIARRFSIIGKKDNFDIIVNGNKIENKDRDDFRSLQFAWVLSEETSKLFPNEVKVFEFPTHKLEITNGENETETYEFSGWIGTAFLPKDLDTKDMGNINGIALISRGRVFQENILDTVSENRIMKSYITGVIEADFLDDDVNLDLATSDRQRIRENDKRYIALKKFIKQLLNEMYKTWSKERKEYDKKEAISSYPQLTLWLDSLPNGHKKQAEDLIATVSNLKIDQEKEDERKEIYRSTILAFERLKLEGSSHELSQAINSGPVELIKLLSSYDSYEVSLYSDVVKARLSTINLLEDKIDKNHYENAIRDFIYEHLWIIDPTWERLSGTQLKEQAVHKAFDKEFNVGLTDEERKGRVDLKYQVLGDEHLIVELKRPKRNDFDEYDLMRQGDKYREGLYKILKNINPNTVDRNRIKVVFLIGERIEGDEKELTDLFSSRNSSVTTYKEMLLKARGAYSDFIKENEKIDKIGKLITSLS